jgi:pantetheine-phosphate adenylyltransferase
MITAVFPGTFDPITIGHIDIIKRASLLVDKLIVAVAKNTNKQNIFTQEERTTIVNKEIKEFKNVEVMMFEGLIVNFLKERGVNFLIRGVRNIVDFDYEIMMASTNKKLYKGVETLFLPTTETMRFISSSVVKQVLKLGGDISEFVTENVKKEIYKKMKYIQIN